MQTETTMRDPHPRRLPPDRPSSGGGGVAWTAALLLKTESPRDTAGSLRALTQRLCVAVHGGATQQPEWGQPERSSAEAG